MVNKDTFTQKKIYQVKTKDNFNIFRFKKINYMLGGQWLKTVDGKDIYIVDYPNRLCPDYDEETAKRITKMAQEDLKFLRETRLNKNNDD